MNGRLTVIVFLKFKNHINKLKGVGDSAYLQSHDAFETWQVCKSEIWTDYKMINRKKIYVNEHINKQIDG